MCVLYAPLRRCAGSATQSKRGDRPQAYVLGDSEAKRAIGLSRARLADLADCLGNHIGKVERGEQNSTWMWSHAFADALKWKARELKAKQGSECAAKPRRSRPRVRNERQGREVGQLDATDGGKRSEPRRAPFRNRRAEVRPRRSARRPCRTRRPHDSGGDPENPVRFADQQVVECQRESPSVRLLLRRLVCVRKSRRVSGGPRVAGRGDHVAVSRHQSRECLAASARRVFRTVEDLGRNATKKKMVVLLGRRTKVLPTIAIRVEVVGNEIPRGADAPPRKAPARADTPRPHARRGDAPGLLLLAPGRGSEQGRRWAAPIALRSLAARSASDSGWAAGVGHAALNVPREERRQSSRLPAAFRSPASPRRLAPKLLSGGGSSAKAGFCLFLSRPKTGRSRHARAFRLFSLVFKFPK